MAAQSASEMKSAQILNLAQFEQFESLCQIEKRCCCQLEKDTLVG